LLWIQASELYTNSRSIRLAATTAHSYRAGLLSGAPFLLIGLVLLSLRNNMPFMPLTLNVRDIYHEKVSHDYSQLIGIIV
jgi:hypothetical protein